MLPTATPTPSETPTPSSTVTPTPLGDCNASPRLDCKSAVKSTLQFGITSGAPAKSKLKWSWTKGAATSPVELGDPLSSTSYRLCLYDGSDTLLAGYGVQAGGTCGTRPCWKAKNGFTYRDRQGSAGGVVGFSIKPGDAGKAKISFRGKGASLFVPDLPVIQAPGAVRVQLVNSSTTSCWGASYTAPATTKPNSWKDSGD